MCLYNVYEDFMSYSNGIYVQTSDKFLGVHAVKVIGWGWDKNLKVMYWRVANSWSNRWGNNGYFNIQMGQCGFEENCFVCDPEV